MSLVVLIQKLHSNDRDAVVQIEEYALPNTATSTGKTDDMGRPVYTLVKEEQMEHIWHHHHSSNTANTVIETANTSNTAGLMEGANNAH